MMKVTVLPDEVQINGINNEMSMYAETTETTIATLDTLQERIEKINNDNILGLQVIAIEIAVFIVLYMFLNSYKGGSGK